MVHMRTDHSDGGLFSTETLSFQMTLACVKLKQKTNQYNLLTHTKSFDTVLLPHRSSNHSTWVCELFPPRTLTHEYQLWSSRYQWQKRGKKLPAYAGRLAWRTWAWTLNLRPGCTLNPALTLLCRVNSLEMLFPWNFRNPQDFSHTQLFCDILIYSYLDNCMGTDFSGAKSTKKNI